MSALEEAVSESPGAKEQLARLRASHDRLLAAAKHVLPLIVLYDNTAGRAHAHRLETAIAAAEEL